MSKLQATPEVLRSITAPMLATLAVLLGACLSPNGGDTSTDVNLSSDTGGVLSTSGASGSSTFDEIMTTTEDWDTSAGSGSESSESSGADGSTSGGSTSDTPANCGDNVIQAPEECDFGVGNANDAGCTADCRLATCGDGLVWKDHEACDDKLNDGAYGGCAGDCMALTPYCGDGVVQEDYEACDETDPKNGCIAATCEYAKSCKEIREARPDDLMLIDGLYWIKPLDAKLKVLCDMDADGGGYTFLKVALPGMVNYNAAQAEAKCKEYGMQLLVPRSPEHVAASVTIAKSTMLAPLGGGSAKSDLNYMKILGIYPAVENMTCMDKPLNSTDCPQWKAAGDKFWVTDKGVPGAPGAKNCLKCSNAYYWKMEGVLDFYETPWNAGVGAETGLFMCDVGDKMPL